MGLAKNGEIICRDDGTPTSIPEMDIPHIVGKIDGKNIYEVFATKLCLAGRENVRTYPTIDVSSIKNFVTIDYLLEGWVGHMEWNDNVLKKLSYKKYDIDYIIDSSQKKEHYGTYLKINNNSLESDIYEQDPGYILPPIEDEGLSGTLCFCYLLFTVKTN